ncbi:helix-turn-helix transcriptional regulator [Shewanella japonica]|uniref:helix-turn-helix transcriptional regulator n=1 Tax=Shewanella japonica TaxID=93973 RepID=UPI0024952DD0|nr:helix-turn-helix domain-containing protein [Shewanella japonica]
MPTAIPAAETKRALSEIETAEYIGMSRSFLRQSRMEGNRDNRTPAPPFIKIGRAVRYLKEDLDAWLDSFYRMEHSGQSAIGGKHV